MRFTDAWLTLPSIVFAIFLAMRASVRPCGTSCIILGCVVLDALCARDPRRGPGCASASSSSSPRSPASARRASSSVTPAQRDEYRRRCLFSLHGRCRGHHRGVAELPGCRRAAARAGVGLDAGGGTLDADGGEWWLTVFPGLVHPAGRAGHAAVRRLAARPPRSAATQPVSDRRWSG